MGKQSTRENKTIYQQFREKQGLTREKASEKMAGISASKIHIFHISGILCAVHNRPYPTISFGYTSNPGSGLAPLRR